MKIFLVLSLVLLCSTQAFSDAGSLNPSEIIIRNGNVIPFVSKDLRKEIDNYLALVTRAAVTGEMAKFSYVEDIDGNKLYSRIGLAAEVKIFRAEVTLRGLIPVATKKYNREDEIYKSIYDVLSRRNSWLAKDGTRYLFNEAQFVMLKRPERTKCLDMFVALAEKPAVNPI